VTQGGNAHHYVSIMLKTNARHRPTAAHGFSVEYNKLCDVVYYEIFDFNETTDVVAAKADAASE
jgi:hypothetical protein